MRNIASSVGLDHHSSDTNEERDLFPLPPSPRFYYQKHLATPPHFSEAASSVLPKNAILLSNNQASELDMRVIQNATYLSSNSPWSFIILGLLDVLSVSCDAPLVQNIFHVVAEVLDVLEPELDVFFLEASPLCIIQHMPDFVEL
nr:hypothetical protein Iba_scaffold6458CG0010 [Ipomoea batatas]